MDKIKREKLQIIGMTCVNCEHRIEAKLLKKSGVISVKARYLDNTVNVTYHDEMVSLSEIRKEIESLDYKVKKTSNRTDKSEPAVSNRDKWLQILAIFVSLFVLIQVTNRFGLLNIFSVFPEAEEGMTLSVLIVIGLLTSVHCVAMCGGINLSQCIPQSNGNNQAKGSEMLLPSLKYNGGRVVSYTLIGGMVGALGSIISFSGYAKGIIAIAASLFMIIMGINMLNLFPQMRKFNPRMPKLFARWIGNEKSVNKNRPFYVGLLNGLMPCGPLQAMQLYALSTEDPIKGALAMFVFSLGTVPLMFGLGALSSFLNHKFTYRMMQISAVLVIFLGLSMFQTGLSVSGIQMPSISIMSLFKLGDDSSSENVAVVENGVQIVSSNVYVNRYEPITVKVGIPVKWTIHVERAHLTSCNDRFEIKALGIQYQLDVGDNVVEFTPTQTGELSFDCWMGMIRSHINVVA